MFRSAGRLEGVWLQFGHGFTAVENANGPATKPNTVTGLQFGHGFTAVENFPGS